MLFKETSLFTKEIQKLMSAGEYLEIQKFLLNNPKHGRVMKGTGGIRRLHWLLDTHGKKGNFEIIYQYDAHSTQETFLMLRAIYLIS